MLRRSSCLELQDTRASMAYAAKPLAFLARSVASVSNKLSIAAVLGLATLPLLPHGAASGSGAGEPRPAVAPIEIVRARPVPIAEERRRTRPSSWLRAGHG